MLRIHADKDYRRKARKAQATSREGLRHAPEYYSRKGRAALEELRGALHEAHMADYVFKANA